MSRSTHTMTRRRARAALAMALLPASMAGCVAGGAAPARTATAGAPGDLMEVATLAPRLNAGPAGPEARDDKVSKAATQVPDVPSPPLPDPLPPASVLPPAPPAGVAPRAGDTPPTIPVGGVYPIDLSAALRLADAENPTIAIARVEVLAALAQQLAARALLLPTLNAGTNYHGHTGDLQRFSGRILSLSEQSLYVGGGARTLAAESVSIPAVNIFSPLTEAIYEPLAARQRLDGSRFDASATANAVLLEVATLYIELLGAETRYEARRETAREADDITGIVEAFVSQGQSPPADGERADVERRLLQAEVQRAEEDVAIASARLSRRLNLDPAVRLRTLGVPLAPLNLVPAETPAEELLQAALSRRPDLKARQAAIGYAEAKLGEEKARPFLPTLWLGFSGGALGGGSNLVPPLVGNFGGRTDFDVRAFWTLQNLGMGNLALQKRRRAEVGQAVADRSRAINAARVEVVAARALALAERQQVEATRAAMASAEAGYREDRALLRDSLARPIEAVNSLRLLNQSRLEWIAAITRANQAQFALFVSLGSPPPAPEGPLPVGPPPIASPLRSPIVSAGASPIPAGLGK